jgi:PqqD family protein of HPr-rel-A system
VTTWRTALALERRELDGQTLAYCDFTGDTFKVAPLTRAVLDTLSGGPADLPALSAGAAAALGASDPADIETVVGETIDDLETLGIIERVSL